MINQLEKNEITQVGGSLAKVVYFTRSPEPPSSPSIAATRGLGTGNDISTSGSWSPSDENPNSVPSTPTPSTSTRLNGALTPLVLDGQNLSGNGFSGLDNGLLLKDTALRRTAQHFPGGSLNFERFETDNIDACVRFIQELIERSAQVNAVSIEEMRRGVKIMTTGGGALKFDQLFKEQLQVEVRREDEMECLIEGLKFITLIPDEAYYFSDELIQTVVHPQLQNDDFERPSPDPPKYSVTFESNLMPQLPCLLVNIGSGVSIIKVDVGGNFERVSGTSLGGGTLWGLLSLLTPAGSFDGMAHSRSVCHSKTDLLNVDRDVSVVRTRRQLDGRYACWGYLWSRLQQTWSEIDDDR